MESGPYHGLDVHDKVAPSKSVVTLPLINSSIYYQIVIEHFIALSKTSELCIVKVVGVHTHIP